MKDFVLKRLSKHVFIKIWLNIFVKLYLTLTVKCFFNLIKEKDSMKKLDRLHYNELKMEEYFMSEELTISQKNCFLKFVLV